MRVKVGWETCHRNAKERDGERETDEGRRGREEGGRDGERKGGRFNHGDKNENQKKNQKSISMLLSDFVCRGLISGPQFELQILPS